MYSTPREYLRFNGVNSVMKSEQIGSVKHQGRIILEDSGQQDNASLVLQEEADNHLKLFCRPERETTDCREGSLEIPLLSRIQGVNKASDFEAAIALIVAQVCEATDWDYGEIWMPSDDSTALELSPVWHIASSKKDSDDFTSLEQFRLCSKGFVLSPGEGLPGRVWLSEQYEWIADATAQSESYCLRNQIARAFDISAGFGVPIIANERVQAVLVFFKLGTQPK
jgi:bHLH-MYC and R2R3-MYB transcription factors N-terminal